VCVCVEGVSDALNTWIMLADSIWDADMNATLPNVNRRGDYNM